jgi:hypothetical protein
MAQMGWGVHSREKKEFGIQIIRQQQPVHIGPFVPYREVIVALVFAFTYSRISNNKVFATDLADSVHFVLLYKTRYKQTSRTMPTRPIDFEYSHSFPSRAIQ